MGIFARRAMYVREFFFEISGTRCIFASETSLLLVKGRLLLPYFFIMLDDRVLERITQAVAETVPEAYVVQIRLGRGSHPVLSVKADTDTGITLAQCTSISRAIGALLEDEPSMDFSYQLEVSSPGIGTPLTLHRQYVKNTGRNLRVLRTDGTELKGRLHAVAELHIELELLPPGGKPRSRKASEPPPAPVLIPFGEIREASVFI